MLIVQNEIRFAIVEAFQREGIEIPFPQRDIHIRSGLDGIGGAGGRKMAPKPRSRALAGAPHAAAQADPDLPT